jgi:hypothetical protein
MISLIAECARVARARELDACNADRWRPLRWLVVPVVVLGFAAGPAPVLASSQNTAATRAVIVAASALARARLAAIPVAQANVESLNRKLAAECPGAGAGSPETEASTPMSKEVAVALWSVSYGTVAAQSARFERAIHSLHWANARFERAVHTFATGLHGLATIPPPALCGDVRTWAASDFKTVPQDALELDRRVEPLLVPEIPWGLIAPYEQGQEASVVASIKRAERKCAEFEFMVGQKDWYQVLETVGVEP